MKKRPIIAAAFHEEKFHKLIFVLFKAHGKRNNFFFEIVKKKFKKRFAFCRDVLDAHSYPLCGSFLHTAVGDSASKL
jgi:hypothetical protein